MPERSLRIVVAVLALVGAAISTYITVVEFSGGTPACVAGGHGCATVANSSYSHMFGVPISVFGIAGYIAVLASAFVPGDVGRLGGFVVSLAGTGFSIYLTYLEIFVIEALCQWCVASAIVMALLLVACGWRLIGTDAPRSQAEEVAS